MNSIPAQGFRDIRAADANAIAGQQYNLDLRSCRLGLNNRRIDNRHIDARRNKDWRFDDYFHR
jgi:hypothetical protein